MLWVCGRFRCISVVGLWFWWCLLTVVCCFGFVADSSGSMVLIVVLAIFFLGFMADLVGLWWFFVWGFWW